MSAYTDRKAIRDIHKICANIVGLVPTKLEWGSQITGGIELVGSANGIQRQNLNTHCQEIRDILKEYEGDSLSAAHVRLSWGYGMTGQPPSPASPLPEQYPYPPPIFSPPLPPTTPPTDGDYEWTV